VTQILIKLLWSNSIKEVGFVSTDFHLREERHW